MALKILILLLMMIFVNTIQAQDVEQVLKADSVSKAFIDKVKTSPLVLNGQLSARAMFNQGAAVSAGGEAFTYLFNGGMNIGFMEYNMPLSFTYTNSGLKYAAQMPLSFNRFNFSPHYKWLRLHLGSSSMSFSPYTLGGMQFKGVGAELTPDGPLTGGFMYGRFTDPLAYNPDNPYSKPKFKRTGYSVNMAFKKEKYQLEASVFSATDHVNSIELDNHSKALVEAMQNLAMSFKGRFTPLKAVSMNIEYATSRINNTLLDNRLNISDLVEARSTAVDVFNAYKLDMSFSPAKFKFGAAIEHIDPGYRTLGAYYSRNDFQNITLNISGNILNNKVGLFVNGGLENDNLKNQNSRGNTRTVGSANLNIAPVDALSINLNYSNFQSYSNVNNQFDYINAETPIVYIDTLNYLQMNQTLSSNIAFTLKNTEANRQVVYLVGNYNQSSASQNNIEQHANNFLNLNGNWSSAYPQKKAMFNLAVNSSFINANNTKSLTWGPVAKVSKTISDKNIKGSVSVAYNRSSVDAELLRTNFNLRGNIEYTYREIHKFNLDFTMYIKHNTKKEEQNSYMLTLGYTLEFKKKEVFFNEMAGLSGIIKRRK